MSTPTLVQETSTITDRSTDTLTDGNGMQEARRLRDHHERISRRVQAVPPSGIRRYFDIAATMDDVITLGIGEPRDGNSGR